MIKKLLSILLLLFLVAESKAQQPVYLFPLPQGWGKENIPLPIEFASGIPIKGMEELRFTPGWGNSKTDEYWSYTFLWFIDGTPKYKSDTLQSYLTQYFTGLYTSNLKNKPKPPTGFTQAQIKKVSTQPFDQQTFEGNITTLDFLTGQPISFYARIHIRNFTAIGHTAVLVEISPKEYRQPVWTELDGVANGFKLN